MYSLIIWSRCIASFRSSPSIEPRLLHIIHTRAFNFNGTIKLGMMPFQENRVANQFRTLTKTRVCFFLAPINCPVDAENRADAERIHIGISRIKVDHTIKRLSARIARIYFSLYAQDLYFERAMIRIKYYWNVFSLLHIYMFVLRIDIIAAWSSLRHPPGHFS